MPRGSQHPVALPEILHHADPFCRFRREEAL
jgi:hypothetical protein